jgi:hypothetical protein
LRVFGLKQLSPFLPANQSEALPLAAGSLFFDDGLAMGMT